MNNGLQDYSRETADWRKTIRQNNYRTYFIIIMFFLLYCGIGMLVDMYISSASYPYASIPELFLKLITFQLFPLATLVMFGVAAVSLFISYTMYDKLMLLGTEYHEITPTTARTVEERQLYNVVEEMKVASGLKYMPKVYIIEANYMNAFASGYSEKSAMIAITRGLMQKLNRDELQAVMAHELSHIRHLDIKVTLTASLLANLMTMVLDIFFYQAYFGSRNGNGDNNRSRNSLATIILILRYTLPIITMFLLLYLSRTRELMADAGAVQLTRNNEPLASALIKISDDTSHHRDQYDAEYQQTPHENVRKGSYIFDPTEAGIKSLSSIADLFSTHPSLATRLAALGFKKKSPK